MDNTDLLIINIGQLIGIREDGKTKVSGTEMAQIKKMTDAYVEIRKGHIVDYGPMTTELPEDIDRYDALGGYVMPTWCDPHTHIVYHLSREQEYVQRIQGQSYEDIARQGGGILNSAKRLQEADEDELYLQAKNRLMEIIQLGTGAVEIKSGYGLTVDSELTMLRVIKRLKELNWVSIKATFLGAHAIPAQYKLDRKSYIDLIINDMLPKIAAENLADYMDVFCDQGFFTVEESHRLLSAGWQYGLRPKIHANELANSGGVQVGVAQNALSVDHLERIGLKEIEALKESDTMPTALPSTSFFLNIPYSPCRDMIDHGLAVALASDYNPGSTPSGNVPFLHSLGCLKMSLLPEECLNATTINAAYAMDLGSSHGSITRGKIGNVIITHAMPTLAFFSYQFGSNLIRKVVLKGNVIGDLD